MTAQILQSTGLRSGLFGGHRLGARKFGVSWRSSSTVARARRSVSVQCTAGTQVVTRHSAYRWQQYDVIMTLWSSTEEVSMRYHQNFLLCNDNESRNYRMHCRFIQQFLWKSVCGCIFHGSAANYSLGEVANSICGQIIYVCNSKKVIKSGQYLRKLQLNEKRVQFFDSQCSFRTHCNNKHGYGLWTSQTTYIGLHNAHLRYNFDVACLLLSY